MLWKWALRRHNKRRLKWVKKKYFRSRDGRDWMFSVKTQDRKGNPSLLCLELMSKIEIQRHIKVTRYTAVKRQCLRVTRITRVKDKASPDDPNLNKYWDDQATKQGKIIWAQGSRNYRIAQAQKWICPLCRGHLFNGEDIETHHKIPVTKGGIDTIDNLVHLHKSCHKHIHTGSSKANTEA